MECISVHVSAWSTCECMWVHVSSWSACECMECMWVHGVHVSTCECMECMWVRVVHVMHVSAWSTLVRVVHVSACGCVKCMKCMECMWVHDACECMWVHVSSWSAVHVSTCEGLQSYCLWEAMTEPLDKVTSRIVKLFEQWMVLPEYMKGGSRKTPKNIQVYLVPHAELCPKHTFIWISHMHMQTWCKL